jgi:hypothetical protein
MTFCYAWSYLADSTAYAVAEIASVTYLPSIYAYTLTKFAYCIRSLRHFLPRPSNRSIQYLLITYLRKS